MQVYVIINNVKIKINVCVNVKNSLTKGLVWNLSSCDCECEKSYDVG